MTAHFGAQLQDRLQTLRMDVTLKGVLPSLQGYQRDHGLDENAEEEVATTDAIDESEDDGHVEAYRETLECYQNSGIDEISDDEFWRLVCHGAPTEEDTVAFHRQYTDAHPENIMRETNRLLDARMQRLRAEFAAAAVRNDQLSMDAIENEMAGCTGLGVRALYGVFCKSAWTF